MPLPLSRNRDFVALWTSQTLSALGTSISSLAYPLVVLELTGSPAQAGLVGAVLGLTTFVLRLPAGLAADRWDRRTIMLVADAARLAAVGSVGVAFLADRATLPHILGAAAVEGAFGVLFGPAEMAAVRHVVHPAQIRDAIARVQSRSQLAGLIGPPIGGALLGVKNALPFLADAVSYLVSFLAVASIGSPLQSDVARRPPTRLAAEIGGGAAWLVRQPFLRALVLWLAGASLAFNSIGLVTMVVARERGATAAEIGVLFGITSAGGVLGALAAPALLRRVRAGAVVVAYGWIAGGAALLLLPTSSPYLIGVIGAVAFLLVPAVNAVLFSAIAVEAPDHLQGRVTSAATQATAVTLPVAPLVAGVLLESVGDTATIAFYAAILLGLAAVASSTPVLRGA